MKSQNESNKTGENGKMSRTFNFKSTELAGLKNKAADLSNDKKLIYVNPKTLIDDEENQYFYDNYQEDIEQLAQSIKRDKFTEVIFAYKTPEGYKIRAGHRRKYAAIKAGLESVPVVLEQPPKNYYERMIGLMDSNNNNREQTPMVIAKTSAKYFEIIQDRRTNDAEYAEKVKGIPTKELVADKMGKSSSIVSKYARLMKLIPELQIKADNPAIAWSTLSSASTLDESKQILLNDIIEYEISEHDISYIKRNFLESIINDLKENVYDTLESYKCVTVTQSQIEVDAIPEVAEVVLNETTTEEINSENAATKDMQNLLAHLVGESSSGNNEIIKESPLVEQGSIEEDMGQKFTKEYAQENGLVEEKNIYDYKSVRPSRKSKRDETIRNTALSLVSLLKDDTPLEAEELENTKPYLIALQEELNRILQ